jgi:hypothetical protein
MKKFGYKLESFSEGYKKVVSIVLGNPGTPNKISQVSIFHHWPNITKYENTLIFKYLFPKNLLDNALNKKRKADIFHIICFPNCSRKRHQD